MSTVWHPRAELKEELSTATLPEIAALIVHDWDNVSSAARPCVDAMFCINTIQDYYGTPAGARTIVTYFLFNASSWRGPVARLVKAELRGRVR